MYAIVGSVLTAGGLLAVMLLMLLFRHPGAPRWSRSELAASLLAVAVTGMLGVGLGYLVLVPHQFASQGASLTDVTVMAGSLAVFVSVWRVLRGRLRISGPMPSDDASVTVLPTPPATPRPGSGRPTRKAA